MFLYFVLGFQTLSKNDCIQQRTAQLNKVSLFIEMCDQYPIVFDIIWALSFNHDIQQQLRSSSSFMSKLAHLGKAHVSEKMRKTVHGILWNLEINHEDRPTSEINEETAFDVMISYSHKDKTLCQQIYDELTKSGYRVWIDFDQMHGNVMDAMAQAIEQSQTVIICMSEDYRKSNYCRAEAHYAFQRQRKIVPVLLQKHYRPDGWLLFLIGQLLYVDFNKHVFDQAMNMLFKELKAEENSDINVSPVYPKEDAHIVVTVTPEIMPKALPSIPIAQNILEWSETQVQQWLNEHNLPQMSRLFAGCDGRSLVYLNKYIKKGQVQQILKSLQEDSLRRINESISLIELSRFNSLMHHQKRLNKSPRTDTDNAVEHF
jgi:hypothetical protein